MPGRTLIPRRTQLMRMGKAEIQTNVMLYFTFLDMIIRNLKFDKLLPLEGHIFNFGVVEKNLRDNLELLCFNDERWLATMMKALARVNK